MVFYFCSDGGYKEKLLLFVVGSIFGFRVKERGKFEVSLLELLVWV